MPPKNVDEFGFLLFKCIVKDVEALKDFWNAFDLKLFDVFPDHFQFQKITFTSFFQRFNFIPPAKMLNKPNGYCSSTPRKYRICPGILKSFQF